MQHEREEAEKHQYDAYQLQDQEYEPDLVCQPVTRVISALPSRPLPSLLLSASHTQGRLQSQLSVLTYVLQKGPLISELRMSSELEAQFADADVNFQTKIHVSSLHLYSGLAHIIR